MAYLDDISDDYLHTPGVTALVYTGLSGTSQAGAVGHKDSLTHREIASGGVAGIEATDVVWIVWASTITGTPDRGGLLTEPDGLSWTVLSVAAVFVEGTVILWRCICRKRV